MKNSYDQNSDGDSIANDQVLKKLDTMLIQKKGILRKGSVIRQMQKRNFPKEKDDQF